MALIDKPASIIISNDLIEGTWVAVDEDPKLKGDGWDELKITLYLQAPNVTVEQAATSFPIGSKLGTRKFWLTGFDGPSCVAPGLYKLEANYKGLAAAQPVVVSYGASAEQQTLENVSVNGVTHPRVTNHENAVTATARYIIEDLSTAPTAQVGQSKTPPNAPAVGASFWIALADPNRHFPSGWVLMGSTTEPLAGTNVGLVSDSYQFIRAVTP